MKDLVNCAEAMFFLMLYRKVLREPQSKAKLKSTNIYEHNVRGIQRWLRINAFLQEVYTVQTRRKELEWL